MFVKVRNTKSRYKNVQHKTILPIEGTTERFKMLPNTETVKHLGTEKA